MTVLYWPAELADGFPWTLLHPTAAVVRASDDQSAAQWFLRSHHVRELSNPRHPPRTLLGPPVSLRYLVVSGPGGIVADVLFSEEEIAAQVAGLL